MGGSRWCAIGLLAVGMLSCGDDDSDATDVVDDAVDESTVEVKEPELRDELLAMQEADQAERTGESAENNDKQRTERLADILDLYGWPTIHLVGEDGASAAWLIAQHSDHDVEFQQRALTLMEPAASAGAADESELAYLEDRVAANTGEPQTYGTQVTCTADGSVEPSGSIRDPDRVDERRADVGLEPLEEYYAEFEEGCTDEASSG